jgi:ubiquinone/menaquinone biosynthesis C-methylase UbiE
VSAREPAQLNRSILSTHALRSLRLSGELFRVKEIIAERQRPESRQRDLFETFLSGVKRRWARERRRRKVGRAYDMALEIARIVPRGSEILDVGCGNGFIAHHLSAMLSTMVVGIDLGNSVEAPIDYRPCDGVHFPLPDNSVDAVLLCYVLHHAQDARAVMSEVRRVLRNGGLAVVYEDIPLTSWDRGFCWLHNRKWHDRTGCCTFQQRSEWRALFESFRFEIISERRLSRWRNLTHAVCRSFYFLRKSPIHRACPKEFSESAKTLSDKSDRFV